MVKKSQAKVDEWCADYGRVHIDYLRFTTKLESLLGDILKARNIGYHLIESRTKDPQSFREKILRGSKSYRDPLKEITDLSGLRIITYYQDDAALIGKAIESEFEVDSANSIQHSPAEAEFGYRSAHYVVHLKNSRTELVEWVGLDSLRAEIQVRTVLQHAWAAISHKLQYKRDNDVPTQLRRKLFRLSALFELADDEFVSLRDASGKLVEQIDIQLATGIRNIPIDHISLSQFIEHSPVVFELSSLASEAGFNFDDPELEYSSRDTTISDFIQLSSYAKIGTLSDLEQSLEDSLAWAGAYLAEQFNAHGRKENQQWYVSPAFICELLLIGAKISHLRPGNLLQLGWHRDIATRVFKVAKEFAS